MMHISSLEHLPNEQHSSDEQGYYFFDMKFITQWKWKGKFDNEQKKLSNYYLGSNNFF